MTEETLEIREIQERESAKTGEAFWVVKTDKGEYTCFEKDVFDALGKNQGKNVEVETFQKGKFKNIRKFIKLSEVQNVKPEKVVNSKGPGRFVNIEMLLSYAKDILIAGKAAKLSDAAKDVVKAYKEISEGI